MDGLKNIKNSKDNYCPNCKAYSLALNSDYNGSNYYELYIYSLYNAKEKKELNILDKYCPIQYFFLHVIQFYRDHKNELFLKKNKSLELQKMVYKLSNDFESGKFESENKPITDAPQFLIEQIITKLYFWDKYLEDNS